MNPEEIKGILAIVSIIEKISSWPFGVVFMAIVVGPWLAFAFGLASYKKRIEAINSASDHKFEAAMEMYKSNVKLVEGYESVSGDLKEVVIMNTQAMTQLCLDVQTNQFCPKVRLDKQAKGVVNE